MNNRLLNGFDRFYRLLLHLYPSEFRQAFGDEMADLFRDLCREAYLENGKRGVSGVWLRGIVDLILNALAERARQGEWEMKLKRSLDVLISLLLLLIGLPFYPLVALLIKLDSPGPVLFRSARVGLRGQLFTSYAFRTMSEQPVTGTRQVTRVGRYLRQSQLDGWPQLWNVLLGKMSLVGLPPAYPEQVQFSDPYWPPLLELKPGLIGPVQLARLEEGLPYHSPRLQQLELSYVQNPSFVRDLSLIGWTLLGLVRWKNPN